MALALRAAAVLFLAGWAGAIKGKPLSFHKDKDATLAWAPMSHWTYNSTETIMLHRRQQSMAMYPMGLQTLEFINANTRWAGRWAGNFRRFGRKIRQMRSKTGIVTHAGKSKQEYIDGAVMLGLSLQEHAPEYPRYAITVIGMSKANQDLLRDAGWELIEVEDWGDEHCESNCKNAGAFLGRWGDSFEKLNAFRVPLGKVLFLDADTYVFSDEIKNVLTSVDSGRDELAMVRDMCERPGSATEFNSGMMWLQPSLTKYARMLELIALHSKDARTDPGEIGKILDQNIINEEYRDHIVELEPKYNCVDTNKDKHCPQKCDRESMVVAHFTGMPKLTRASPEWLNNVRTTMPEQSVATCGKSNHGSCYRWADFYCAMEAHKAKLSPLMQDALVKTGKCQPPAGGSNYGQLAQQRGMPRTSPLLQKAVAAAA